MSDQSNLNRQQIRDRLRQTSREEVVLEEMKRLGFWPGDEKAPALPEQLIKREGELRRELSELLAQQRKTTDKEALLKEIRLRRMEESRRRQKENKERRKQERLEKAQQWQALKQKEIIYLGEGVSAGLQDTDSDEAKLKQKGFPYFRDTEALAKALDIDVPTLRFLAFNRQVSKVSHYKRFYIQKKSGGKRTISAPMPKLKKVQHWILHHLMEDVKPHEAAHGFVTGKSIVSNAQPHLQADLLVNLDLKDFFPSVSYKRVKGVFRSLGYSEKIATILGLLCTEPEVSEVEMDGRSYYVAKGPRVLPQGAPTSPAITNILCRRLDVRLQGLALKYGFTYTRYADDLSFSVKGAASENLTKLLGNVRRIIKDEGFVIHPDKLRVMRRGSRQEVTGVVVNQKPNICRKKVRNFKALLFQIEKDGIAGKHWQGSDNLLASIKGYAHYIAMVNPELGKPLVERVEAILKKHKYKHLIKHPAKKKPTPEETQPTESKKKPWWKFW